MAAAAAVLGESVVACIRRRADARLERHAVRLATLGALAAVRAPARELPSGHARNRSVNAGSSARLARSSARLARSPAARRSSAVGSAAARGSSGAGAAGSAGPTRSGRVARAVANARHDINEVVEIAIARGFGPTFGRHRQIFERDEMRRPRALATCKSASSPRWRSVCTVHRPRLRRVPCTSSASIEWRGRRRVQSRWLRPCRRRPRRRLPCSRAETTRCSAGPSCRRAGRSRSCTPSRS